MQVAEANRNGDLAAAVDEAEMLEHTIVDGGQPLFKIAGTTEVGPQDDRSVMVDVGRLAVDLDGRHAGTEWSGIVKARGDDCPAARIQIAVELFREMHAQQAFRESFEKKVQSGGNHHPPGLVDESPFIADQHRGEPFGKWGDFVELRPDR